MVDADRRWRRGHGWRTSAHPPALLVRMWMIMRLMWLSLMLWSSGWAQEVDPTHDVTTEEVIAVAGDRVLLPCDLGVTSSSSERRHQVSQVSFLRQYGGDAYRSIYRIHAAGRPLSQGSHWVPGRLMERALVVTSGPEKGLVLERVGLEDGGEYQCRVEYEEGGASDTYTRIRLKVVVQPSKVLLFVGGDPSEVIGEVAGPYRLGEMVTLSCQVTGGHPSPQVTWWDGSLRLDDSTEYQVGQVRRNDLSLGPMTRADLNRSLTCRASNSQVVDPLTTSVTLDLHYPPSSVKILGETGGEVIMRADLEQDLKCQVLGSRPSPRITWRVRGRPRPGKVSTDGEVTSSTLTLTPEPDEDGSEVTCSAHNPELTHNPVRASAKLSVLYRPRVKLLRSLNLDLQDFQEGDDLDLRCQVRANPPASVIGWTRDGEAVERGKGVFVSDFSLLMEDVTREASGSYACSASNSEGTSRSNQVLLRVKFAPVCSSAQERVVRAAAHVQVRIGCSVESHPPPTSFRWTMNASSGEVDVPSTQFHWAGLTSSLLHTPPTQHYYRRLLCWAANQVGEQREPCQSRVVPEELPTVEEEEEEEEVPPLAAVPESVANCTVEDEVEVRCDAGGDLGLDGSFVLEVRDAKGNITQVHRENRPIFAINRLRPGVRYLLEVKASDDRGTSPPHAFTHTPGGKGGAGSSSSSSSSSSAGRVSLQPRLPSSWLATLLATAILLLAGSIVALQAVVVVLLRLRRVRRRDAHALLNGDPVRVDGFRERERRSHVAGSSTSINNIEAYIERERKKSLAMGEAPRASMDSLCMSTAPPSLYSDPFRSIQPSPCVGLGEEEERAPVDEGEGEGGGGGEEEGDNPVLEALLDNEGRESRHRS